VHYATLLEPHRAALEIERSRRPPSGRLPAIIDAPTPQQEYRQRLTDRAREAERLATLDARLGVVRLSLAALALAGGWAFFVLVPSLLLVAPVAAFVGAVVYHHFVRRHLGCARRAVAYYERGLARIEDRWNGTGPGGERFETPHHQYAADLDLFGRHSLFELLSTARTRMGEEALADWILSPAPLHAIRGRHASMADLRPRLDLREDMAVLGEPATIGVRPDALLEWAEAPNRLERVWIAPAALVLPALAVAAATVWILSGPATPLVVVLVIEAAVLYRLGARLAPVIRGTEKAFEDLSLFAELLLRVERERFETESLKALVERLSSHTTPASQTIGRLVTIAGFMEARRNPLVGILSVPLLYPLLTALAAERWRRKHGAVVRAWVAALGEFEALCSIAAYAYEHPEDRLPEFVDGPARFEAEALGHPLIPASRCVRNDVTLAEDTRVMLVSGSNMSGKSTLLRTVGINTVLAMMGAPARARRLRLTPLQVGASIRINDSLHEGSSRFYAEITRLRELRDLTERPLPLLFLLDELLQGTNSKDRRIGAEGIIRAFVARGAIGIVSTHDLALTDIDLVELGGLRNKHFQDHLDQGQMKFDFTLRDGPVTKSNAVELMRSIGLEV
jgi:hypothetical protein